MLQSPYVPTASAKHKNCRQCKLYRTCRTPFMRGGGGMVTDKRAPLVLLVGEAPGANEDEDGYPFHKDGDSGKMIRELLAGYKGRFILTNAVRCRPERNKLQNNDPVNYCRLFLQEEIEAVRPDFIMVLGDKALSAVLGKSGITKARRHVFHYTLSDGKEIPTIPCFHPAYILRDMNRYEQLVGDVRYAMEIVSGNGIAESKRTRKRIIDASAKDIAAMHEGLRRTKARLVFDCETNSKTPERDVENFRMSMASLCDGVSVLVVRLDTPDHTVRASDPKVEALLSLIEDPTIPKVGHNVKYDMHSFFYRFDCIPQNIVCDTMVLHSFLYPMRIEHDLKSVASDLLGVHDWSTEIDKLTKGKDGTAWFTPEVLRLLPGYAADDAENNFDLLVKLDEMLADEDKQWHKRKGLGMPPTEYFRTICMPAMRTLFDIEHNGFPVDEEKGRAIEKELELDADKLARQLRRFPVVKRYEAERYEALLASDKCPKTDRGKETARLKCQFNPNSDQQVGELLFGNANGDYFNLESDGMRRTDKGRISVDRETRADLLAQYANSAAAEFLRLYNEYSLLHDERSTFVTGILKRLSDDGRVRSSFRQEVASTGRLCVAGDTILSTDVGDFRIDSIPVDKLPNLKIRSHTGAWRRILRRFYKGEEQMYEVTTDNAKAIRCTANHRLLTQSGWKAIKFLRPGDILYADRGAESGFTQRVARPRVPMLCSVRGELSVPLFGAGSNLQGDREEVQRTDAHDGADLLCLGRQVHRPNTREAQKSQSTYDEAEHPWGKGQTHSAHSGERPTPWDTHGANGSRNVQEVQSDRVLTSPEPQALRYRSSIQRAEKARLRRNATFAKDPQGISGNRGSCQKLRERSRAVLRLTLRHICRAEQDAMGRKTLGEGLLVLDRDAQVEKKPHLLVKQPRRNPDLRSATCGQSTTCQAVGRSWFWEYVCGHLYKLPSPRYRGRWALPSKVRRHTAQRQNKGTPPQESESKINAGYTQTSGKRAKKNGASHLTKIQSIEPVGVMGVWDIEVEEDHSYVAHGLIHHNSSKDPNLQNLKKKSKARGMFCTTPGRVLIEADYSQIELRLAAAVSRDPDMIEIFKRGYDLHEETARAVFHVPEKQAVPDEKRRNAKTVNFGIIYEISAYGLQKKLEGASQEYCQELIDGVYRRFPRLRDWQEEQHEYARKHGCVYTMFGRKRTIENCRIKVRNREDERLLSEAFRQATNAPIQGGAADIMLVSATKLNEVLRDTDVDAFMVNLIHDSIMLDCAEEDAERAANLAYRVMIKEPMKYVKSAMRGVPIDVDIKAGRVWSELETMERSAYAG